MTDMLREYCDSRGVAVRVDRQAGVIRGVKVLGLESRNGRVYLPDALAQAVSLYEDAKVNVNHPKGSPSTPRDYQDRIGAIRNVALRDGEGLFGDFHFNPKHALAEQLIWDAENAAENVGFSHNVEARVARRGDQTVVEAITRVQSVDLVADPATTRGLFESAGSDAQASENPPTLDELVRDHHELVENAGQSEASEIARLREEVERLKGVLESQRKREQARRLLREYDLPDDDASEPWAKTIVSRQFMESLAAAPDDRAMRTLVEERARLVRLLLGDGAPRGVSGARPQSRDQHLMHADGPLCVKSFVEAIT
jgi:hypothetical protein